jgi:hypothetical protein
MNKRSGPAEICRASACQKTAHVKASERKIATKGTQENICQGGFHPKDEIPPINWKLSYTSVRVTAAF